MWKVEREQVEKDIGQERVTDFQRQLVQQHENLLEGNTLARQKAEEVESKRIAVLTSYDANPSTVCYPVEYTYCHLICFGLMRNMYLLEHFGCVLDGATIGAGTGSRGSTRGFEVSALH